MKRGELASDYLKLYDGTDVTVDVVRDDHWDGETGFVIFALSDGVVVFADSCYTCTLTRMIDDDDVVWDDDDGWIFRDQSSLPWGKEIR